MDLLTEASFVESLIDEAQNMALDMQGKGDAWSKPNNQGPVSDADIAIDQFITNNLKKRFPHDDIISEESYISMPIKRKKRMWLIDPIDGTGAYIKGRDDYTIMIGLLIDSTPMLGIIARPAFRQTFIAINSPSLRLASMKTHKKKTDLNVIAPHLPLHQVTLALSRTFTSKKQQELIRYLDCKNIHYKSSIGYKACMVAENAAQLYVAFSKRLCLWDTCAPSALIKAMGGIIVSTDNKELCFKGGVIHHKPLIVTSLFLEPHVINHIHKIAL